ncbi:MAG: ribosome biogenesis GTPase Der [Deltaproteobacteria bacterium]|nr:ribosome biogenesis GTPase Der [Deltaproteobacteria bacterium]
MKPIVAIVGRPNVGKSTLFNRITRTRRAIVDDLPGVTRDRIYHDVCWDKVPFTVVDTGGFSDLEFDKFGPAVRCQVIQAIEEADAIIVLFDGREGITPADRDLVQTLRRSNKSVFYCVNKIDGPRQESAVADFSVLGVQPLYPISAEHGYGVGDLMDGVVAVLPESAPEPVSDRIRLAVIGRPNVGKSSLINRLLRDERLLVSEIPGTTRDVIDTVCKVGGREYLLIDTAGIRRKARVKKKLEKFSIIKALKSLNGCDIALIMMDASEGVTDQDVKIAGYALERGRACVILLNKWDLVDTTSMSAEQYVNAVKERLSFMRFAPVLTISALTGKRVFTIFDIVQTIYGQYTRRIGTGEFNRILESVVAQHEPPSYRRKRVRFYYGTQLSGAPPTFLCFVNYPQAIHASYKRYLTGKLQKALGLEKTPIRLIFRKREKR